MWMPERTLEREYMDDHEPEQAVVDDVYRFLSFINRWLGGSRATLQRFDDLSRTWKSGERIDVLDVATGAGDVPGALIAWGRRRGFDVRVTALDVSPRALDYARRQSKDGRMRLLCADIHRPPWRDGVFDYVTCALFLHHLADAEIIGLLQTFDALAKRGIVINDLMRRWRLYIWTWLFTRAGHPIVRRDGPLSVRKSLRPGELEALSRRAGLPWLSVREHFGHRMTLAGERRQPV